MGEELPRRSKVLVSRKRRSLIWVRESISPISSRKRVPWSAPSKRPMRFWAAPVKAPFSWPQSSLSRRLEGRAAQWTAMKGLRALGLFWWIIWAKSSLPVPVSPWRRTVALVGATWASCLRDSWRAGEWPMMFSGDLYFLSRRSWRFSFSFSSSLVLRALD